MYPITVCSDKKHQETPRVHMQPQQPRSSKQSVTKSNVSIRKQAHYKNVTQHDKNCQSRCCIEKGPRRPVCDKNC